MDASRRFRRGAVAVIAAALVLSPGTAFGAPGDGGDRKVGEVTSSREMTARFANTTKWFVELQSEPTASGGSRTVIERQHRQIEAEAKSEGASVSRKFTTLFNGITVAADADTAQALAELPEVKAIYPVIPVAVPENQKSKPGMFTAGTMTGADIVRNELGYTGKGVKVGIIDTGIDFDHPDLGGSGTNGATTFPTARVKYGFDFVGDDYNADPTSPGYQPVPHPDAVPDDCQGHGTHVAGIVGANGTITGVAPEVTFGAYRVFGCDGSTDTEIILAALERAEADRMDVVNMSLGAGFESWPQYPTATASDRLVRGGIVVVNSAGNEGDLYTQSVGAPSTSDLSIGVASFDNIRIALNEIRFNRTGSTPISAGYVDATGSPAITSAVNATAVAAMTDPLGCTPGGDVAGRIAIVSRGTCTFHEKAVAAQASDAKALVIYNNAPGFISPTVAGDTPITIPVIMIGQADGQAVVASLATGVTAEVTGAQTSVPNPTGGLISDFSSWGLAADLTLKPDLGAPGGSIQSTFPLEKGGRATLSGTSMAAPHVSGAVALVLQSKPTMAPAEVLSRLQNTAEPALSREAASAGILDAAHRQGAGLIQIDKAILAEAVVSPSKLSAGESEDGPFTQTLTVTNTGDAPVTWTLSHEDAISTIAADETQNEIDFLLEPTKVTFSANSVTVPAGGKANVAVTIVPDAQTPQGTQYSGFVVLTSAEGATVSVPFAGMAGDYGALDIFPGLGAGFPSLAYVNSCSTWDEQQCIDPKVDFEFASAGRVFKGNGDNPTVAVHQAYPVRSLKLEAILVKNGTPDESTAAEAYSMDYKGRSAGIDLYSWDGRVRNSSGLMVDAAPGQYVLRLTAVEADGDGGTQAWTSAPFQFGVVKPAPTPSVPTPTVPTQAPIVSDVYNTPGYHNVNGRRWLTTCEKYSQTTRCRTQIWATTVNQVGGRFVASNGWLFNNLTYLPGMTRQQWGTNPLANTTSWKGKDGRQWRTECDTAATGRGGCRTFIKADVISATKQANGSFTYKWEKKEILNNMVRFKNA